MTTTKPPKSTTDDISDMLEVGLARHERGEFAVAEADYTKILRIDPRHADALNLCGVAQHQQGNHAAAVKHIEKALQVNPAPASFHSNLGTAYHELGRIDDAAECFVRATAIAPKIAGYHYNLANALRDREQFEPAIAEYEIAIELDPQFADAHNNLGSAMKSVDRVEDAIDCHRRAIALREEFPEAWFNLGNAYRRIDRFDSAAASYQRSVDQSPKYVASCVDSWINLGYTHEDRGMIDDAVKCYEAALDADPNSADAHLNLALLRLQKGWFDTGWDEYEWRWKRSNIENPRSREDDWNGTSLVGKSIFVYLEQGIGDIVMFVSCLTDLLNRRPARVHVECDYRLVTLLRRAFPNVDFVANNVATQAVEAAADFQIALGSLPRIFRRTIADFPREPRFLFADETQTLAWRERFSKLGPEKKIGISWRGGKDATVRRRRSTDLQQWRPLFDQPNTTFVNLQYGATRDELDSVRAELGVEIQHWDEPNPLYDLDGFTAMMSALDLVISVDNATVHLAGALGVPVWTLLPYSADWRWLTDRDDSPWYASMTLFRQPHFGDWDAVFSRAADELSNGEFKTGDGLNTEGVTGFAAQRSPQSIAPNPTMPGVKHRNQRKLPLVAPNRTAGRHTEAEALNNTALDLQSQGQYEEALPQLLKARELAPAQPHITYNLYRKLNRPDLAVECYDESLSFDPASIETQVNRGVALRESGDLIAAESAFDNVLRQSPEQPEARFNRGLVRLHRGDFPKGWRDYESRWHTGEAADPAARLMGDAISFDGQQLLVRAEQGIGDEIMFASCLPDLLRSAKSCIVECDRRLVPLFARSFPTAVIVPKPVDLSRPIRNGVGTDPVSWDLAVPCGSLPLMLRNHVDDFPPRESFLIPAADRVTAWRLRFAELGNRLTVGISWSGGKNDLTRRQRSAPLEQWREVFDTDGVGFVNLQYGQTAADVHRIRQQHAVDLHHFRDCDPLANLDDFAAQVAAVDLVISVDNSTVHLAGAIGAPVWTLLPRSADWRWIHGRKDSPWYPTMRLFQQTDYGDWSGVFKEIAGRLQARLDET